MKTKSQQHNGNAATPPTSVVTAQPQTTQDRRTRAAFAVSRLRELRRGVTLGGIDWRELRDTGRRF